MCCCCCLKINTRVKLGNTTSHQSGFLLTLFCCCCCCYHPTLSLLVAGERSLTSPLQSDLDAFHSGFQTCAKEVLQYLSRFESWTPREQRCRQLVNHLHVVCMRFLPSPQLLTPKVCGSKGPCSTSSRLCIQHDHAGPKLQRQPNCVPVIQRTQKSSTKNPSNVNVELSGENDTDTDSGYGGESEGRPDGDKSQGHVVIKQEPPGEEAPPVAKKVKLDCSSPSAVLSAEQVAAALLRPNPALLSSLVAVGGLGEGGGGGEGSPFSHPPAAPICLPFCFISPSAAATYMQPFLDKSNLEKYLYPAAAATAASPPIPLIYPGIPAQAAAAAAAFPYLSSVLAPAEKANSASALLPPPLASFAQHLLQPFACSPAGLSMDTDLPSQEQAVPHGKESP